MQTILGSGGAIGKELAQHLSNYTGEIRLVSRQPKKINETDQLLPLDLTQPANIFKAIEGSEVVYITVGFPYSKKVWREVWPPFMGNVIEACKKHHSKLVFFDNVYMYGPDQLDGMNEQAEIAPVSEKGRIRAEIANMLTTEMKAGNLEATIARSADFYGPSIQNVSLLTETVFKPLSQGKKANWMGPLNFKHSFTYAPDAGQATAILGNSDKAFGQVWHLPTAENPPTGKKWVEMIAVEMNTKPRVRPATKSVIKVMGWFMPIMKELHEMMYQYDRDYVFDSKKFESAFDFKPTPYREGVKAVIDADYS